MFFLKFLARVAIILGGLVGAFAAIVLFGSVVAKIMGAGAHVAAARFALVLVIAALVVAAGWIALALVAKRFVLEPTARFHLPDTKARFTKQIVEEVDRLTEALDQDERLNSMSLAMEYWKYIDRTIEEVKLADSRIERKVSRAMDLTTLSGPRRRPAMFVPVLRHRKGVLIDRLEVSVNDQNIDTLAFRTNMAMNVLVFREFWLTVTGDERGADRDTISKLATFICSPRAMSAAKNFSDELNLIKTQWVSATPATSLLSDEQQTALRFLQYLADYYIVWAKLPAARTTQVTLDISYSERRVRTYKGLSNKTRLALGVPIYEFYVPLTEPLEAQSYHFRADAPDDTYLYSANFLGVVKGTEEDTPSKLWGRLSAVMPQDVNTDRLQEEVNSYPTAVISPSFGTSYSHAYTRDLHYTLSSLVDVGNRETRGRVYGLFLHLVFRPVPPGLSGLAAIIATYLLTLTTAVALLHDQVFGEFDVGVPGAITILSALPALMSAWIVARFAGSGLRSATPILIFEIMSLLAISLLTAGVATLKAAKKVKDPATQFPLFDHVYGHPWWTLVWTLALAQFVLSILCLFTRLLQYLHAQSRARQQLRRDSE